MSVKKTREQIINDLQEANAALEITTYDSLVLESDATWLYVDKVNGNDTNASQYFIDNTSEVHNESVPFATYSGASGAIELWTAREAAADARFVNKWPIIVDVSENVVWEDEVPINTIANTNLGLIWCGFDFYSTVLYNNNTYLHCSIETGSKTVTSMLSTVDNYPTFDFFFGRSKNIIFGSNVANKRTIINFYKSALVNSGTGSYYSDSVYKFVNCAMTRFWTYNSAGIIDTINTAEIYTLKNCIMTVSESYVSGSINFADKECSYSILPASAVSSVSTDDASTCLFDSDPELIDPDNGILFVKPSSPSLGTGENGSDIGLGVGFAQRDVANDTLLPEITRGVLANAAYDSSGNVFVEYTELDVISATTTTVVLPSSSPDADSYFNGLKLRTFDAGGTLVDERTITGYDGTTKTVTVDSAFSVTPDTTYTVNLSATVESTVMNYEMEIDKIFVSEIQKHSNGLLVRGTSGVLLKTSNILNGGRIPQSGDVDYNATLHDYKEQLLDYVRIDASGYGSANASFDPSTASQITCRFLQMKLEVW